MLSISQNGRGLETLALTAGDPQTGRLPYHDRSRIGRMHPGNNLGTRLCMKRVGFTFGLKLAVAADAGPIAVVDLPADFAVSEYALPNAHAALPLALSDRLYLCEQLFEIDIDRHYHDTIPSACSRARTRADRLNTKKRRPFFSASRNA